MVNCLRLNINQRTVYNLPYSALWGWLSMEISLKILNSGIILTTFTHAIVSCTMWTYLQYVALKIAMNQRTSTNDVAITYVTSCTMVYTLYMLPHYLSLGMGFPTMWCVQPAKPWISLRIRTVWSEPLLVAWIFYECYTTDWTWFGVFKLKMRLQRLVWVYTCQNATLLEIIL